MTNIIITPSESMVSVPVPPSYIGRQVEVTFTLIGETNKSKTEIKLSNKFRGVLSKESAESFIEHTKTMRNEWKNI
jgi:hypothetical protein